MKQALSDILRHSGLLPAAVAAVLQISTFVLLGEPVYWPLILMAFCGVGGLYQLDRLGWFAPEDRINQPRRERWAQRNALLLQITAAIFFIVAAAMIPLLAFVTVVTAAVLAVAGVSYILPLFRGVRLKSSGVSKPLVISVVWVAGVVALPAIEAGVALTQEVLGFGVYRWAVLWAVALLADWPDRDGDWQAGIQTPAVRWSQSTLWMAACVPLAIAGGAAGGLAYGYGNGPLALDALGYILLLYWLTRTDPDAPGFAVRLDAFLLWPLLAVVAASAGWF